MRKESILSMSMAAVAAALICGECSAASVNPFADVPKDHWAYDAVETLVQDGVVDGYGDNTYCGDRAITRYEMAHMVAKAMAKTDVSAADRSVIDKLATEFSSELGNLGVRVANLERNVDKVKWNGVMEYTYTSTRHDTQDPSHKTKHNDDDLLFRLEPNADLDSHWSAHARLDAQTKLQKDSGVHGSEKVELKRVWAEGRFPDWTIKVGKLPNEINTLSTSAFMNYSGTVIHIDKEKLNTTLELGRIDACNFRDLFRNKNGHTSNNFLEDDDTTSYQGINVGYNLQKFHANAGFQHFNGATMKVDPKLPVYRRAAKDTDEFKADIYFANAGYAFDRNNSLFLEYAKNEKAEEENHAYSVEYGYKGANSKNAGSYGLYLAYRNLGQYAAPWSGYGDALDGGQKGWEVGAKYAPAANVLLIGKYFKGKDIVADRDAEKLFGRVDFFF